MVRVSSEPVPDESVTPLALQVLPETIALTHVAPPLAEIWITSPARSVPANVPLTVCPAVLVMKSELLAPLSALRARIAVTCAVGPLG